MMRSLAVAVITVFGMGGSGAVVASGSSLPGDALYPVKQAVEAGRVATAFSPEGKAATHLTIADEKLKEVAALQERRGAGKGVAKADEKLKEVAVLQERRGAGEGIAKAAEQMAQHQAAAEERLAEGEAKGKDVEALVARLRANAERQQGVLAGVLEKVPDQAKGAIRHAMEVSQRGLENAAKHQAKAKGPKGTEPGASEGPDKARGNSSAREKSGAAPGPEEGRGKPVDLPRGR